MAVGSPTVRDVSTFPYGAADSVEDIEDAGEGAVDAGKGGNSMYVALFKEMATTVLQDESFLLEASEIDCFERYRKLSYEAQYLLVRLCQRKADQWIPFRDLQRYRKELGDNVMDAMQKLCGTNLIAPISVKEEEVEITDLTSNGPVAGPSVPKKEVKCDNKEEIKPLPLPPLRSDHSVFAEDGSRADVRELLECLTRDDLAILVKEMRLKPENTKKDSLINTLIKSTCTQTTLPFVRTHKGKVKLRGETVERGLKQTTLRSFVVNTKKTMQQDRLREIVLERLGGVIKLNMNIIKLFRRVNMIYFRSTLYEPKIMVAAILARAKKRVYPAYALQRTERIWSSRTALLDYEAALQIEAEIDTLFGSTSITTARARSRSAVSHTPASVKGEKGEADVEPENMRVRDARAVKALFQEVYDRWKKLLQEEEQAEIETQCSQTTSSSALQRFHCGHILTRIVCKGAHALGILKEYEAELEVLETLLSQRRWRKARRGRWYERRALILMTYLAKSKTSGEEGDATAAPEKVLQRAYDGVWEALRDEDTHIVYRPKLRRRLVTLERKLRIPDDEQHICDGILGKPANVYIEGDRVRVAFDLEGRPIQASTTPKVTRGGRIKSKAVGKDDKQQVLTVVSVSEKQTVVSFSKVLSSTVETSMTMPAPVATGKSIWRGRGDEEVTVEIFALQRYEDMGFKGYHCEGRIITTLFGLLCWDIIFASVPGAFETQYQNAPLDIAEDTFFYSREELAKARFADLRNVGEGLGEAAMMIDQAWTKHEGEMCIGVRWDLFRKEDMMEIAECIGGPRLAVICQLLCEDYAGRIAGVPDLVVWNAGRSLCKFVEVKGPGDSLQENQKVWLDVLLQAQIPAEVCYVEEKGATRTKGKGKLKKSTVGNKRKRDESEEGEFDETLLESEDDEPVQSHMLLDLVPAETVSPVLPLPIVLSALHVTPPRKPPRTDSGAAAEHDQQIQHQLLSPSSMRSSSTQRTPHRQGNTVEVVITSPPRKRARMVSPEL